jgi:L-rhamnose mutarotase
MERVAFLLGVKDGTQAEYRRRHDQIWPEMVKALQDAGARNYSIFFDTDHRRLFAYLEADPDFRTFLQRISTDPVNARWQEYMKDLMDFPVDPKTNFPIRFDETFHLD